MRRTSRTVAASLLLAICARARGSDSFESRHERAIAANPVGLHFIISLPGERNQFRIGEPIRLQYTLSSDAGDYRIGARAFDKSGRSVLENFEVDRSADVSDPLRGFWDTYSAIYCLNFISRASPNWSLDRGQVRQDSIDITEYLRFHKPGRYRVYAITQQISPSTASPNVLSTKRGLRPDKDASLFSTPAWLRGGVRVVSENVVSFEILPEDTKAKARELQGIVSRTEQNEANDILPADATRLIEIGTTDAQHAALQLYFRPGHHPNDVALSAVVGSSDPESAVAMMQERLRDPKLPLDGDFLLSLALLQLLERDPLLTGAAIRNGDRSHGNALRNILLKSLRKDFEEAMKTLEERSGAVRALTVKSLIQLQNQHACSGPLEFPESDNTKLIALHLSTLPELPAYDQLDELMNFDWAKNIPKEQLLPVLRAVYESANRKASSWSGQIRRYALGHIVEIDSAEARRLALADIANLGSLDPAGLAQLNLRPGPDFDADLIGILEARRTEEMEHAAPLIGLYGTAGILDRVKKVYEVHAGSWPCSIESGLLAYFLRVDSAYGTRQLSAALANFPKSDLPCSQGSLLQQVSTLYKGPELMSFGMAALNDQNPKTAGEAVRILNMPGAKSIPYEDFLARLEDLHNQWQDFDTKKNDAEYMQHWNSGYSQLELALVFPLMNVNDSAEHLALWKKAYDFCITDVCRDRLRRRIQHAEAPASLRSH